ncbi:hypothetical protein MCOR25_009152 [Pyricularia grisea]|uniref:Uncharacterized protein n=1 Tax=Pyricularia grisea TaxID=148305 RepID=A0A6P8AQ22_PYRGI|nr:hypothetical protein PgNI_11213 [Pyricularia grisea]KAI6353141.1 hypothetical protein MCOR25_009152 [Pyricularia grisea]TLD04118.1 hypothetical protein PgNI_11213 [Pyricularia grisea]
MQFALANVAIHLINSITTQSATLTAICQDAINPTPPNCTLPRLQLTTHGRLPPPTGRGCSPEAQLQAQSLKDSNSGLQI